MIRSKIKLLITIIFFINTATLTQFAIAAEYAGTMSYDSILKLTSPISGKIQKISEQGKLYQSGETLVQFDKVLINNEIKLNNKQLKLAQLVLSEQEKDMERAQELYDANNLADYDLKQAQMKLLEAQVNLQSAKNNQQSNYWLQQFYRLKAPTSGFIVTSHIYPGQYINNKFSTPPLLSFVPADDIMIKVKLDKNEFNQLSLGGNHKNVTLVDGEKSYSAQLMSMNEQAKQIVVNIKLNPTKNLPADGSLVQLKLDD